MASIFLISSNTVVEPYPVYPIGMSIIAAALQNAGHKVVQYDMLVHGQDLNDLTNKLKRDSPDYVGISIRNVDNVDSFTSHKNGYIQKVKEIIHSIKILNIQVIVGGAGFSLLPDEILSFIGADYGIIGEGEQKMVKLIQQLESKEKPQVIYGPQKGLSSSEMLSPRWSPELVKFYLQESGIINIQTKRGCENRCAYCTYPALEGHRMRFRPTETVAAEIELLCSLGAEHFFFTDSVFNDRTGHYLTVAEEIIRRNINIKWSAFFQPHRIENDELQLLKRSGMQAIEVGTDATSDTTLRAMNKGFSLSDVIDFNEKCIAQRIPCAHFVIFGGPEESMQTVHEGINNMNSLRKCVVFPFSGIRLHKESPLFARALNEGIVYPEQPLLDPLYYFSPLLDKDEMNDTLIAGFKKRRDRLFPPDEGQQRINIMKKFGFRGIMWDQLIRFDN